MEGIETMSMLSRRRKAADVPPTPRDVFVAKKFELVVKDMESGRLPLKKTTITDPMTVGLSVLIRSTGLISYQVQYSAGKSRPQLTIGHHPEMTIDRARKIAETIRHLVSLGIDPQEGLHDRLIRELEKQGNKWRPS